ncbi:MAG: undecaprenyl-phosphate glucose phosphotransferase [Nevskiales bacterium]
MSGAAFRPRRLPDVLALSLWLLPIMDMLIVLGATAGISWGLTWLRETVVVWPWAPYYQVAVSFWILLTPLVFFHFQLYHSYRGESLAVELTRVTAAWVVVAAGLVLVAVATKTSTLFSRVWMTSCLVGTLGLFWATRIGLRLALAHARQLGWDTREILLVGGGRAAERVVQQLGANRWAGYWVRGYFCEQAETHGDLSKLSYLGPVDRIEEYVAQSQPRPDQVWIVMSTNELSRLRRTLAVVGRTLLDCRLVPSMMEFSLLNYSVSQVAGLPVLDLSRSPMSGLNRLIKAAEDRILAALIVTIAAPLMLCIALGVKLSSPGPALFQQRRHGWNGEEITVLKFRTMYALPETEGAFAQARRDDPRVTAFGAFLRRTSLDELPQFFNVLGGTMSVVGPRPHPIELNKQHMKLVEGYMLRHKVKPGITGWAQVNGLRGETDTLEKMQRRVEYDLYYIEHWSLWLDLAIVVLTLMKGFISPRAY